MLLHNQDTLILYVEDKIGAVEDEFGDAAFRVPIDATLEDLVERLAARTGIPVMNRGSCFSSMGWIHNISNGLLVENGIFSGCAVLVGRRLIEC